MTVYSDYTSSVTSKLSFGIFFILPNLGKTQTRVFMISIIIIIKIIINLEPPMMFI